VFVRLLVAPLVLGVVLGVLWLHDHTGDARYTDALMALFGAGAAVECVRLLRAPGREIALLPAVALSGLLAGVGLLAPDGEAARFVMRSLLVGVGVVLPLVVRLRDVREEALGSIALSFVPWCYVGFLLSFSRELADGPEGARRLIVFVVVAKASDMGGWVVGKAVGRHRMIPSVSPGKTWEGTAGGIAASALAAVFLPGLLGLTAEAAWSVPQRVGYGVLVAAAAILAGVTQSGWKRRVGVKDSSRLIPHMGGLLDMVDSLLLAGPVAWAWYRVLA
jgi:phosphatidate cytidylyltransferase